MANHQHTIDRPDPRTKDLSAQRFNNLTVIAFAGYRNQRAYWTCRCDCGRIVDQPAKVLQRYLVYTCGCRRFRHGVSATPRKAHRLEYAIFSAMWSRCTNPYVPEWLDYGGRGITVCERWQNFETFLEDVGVRPSPQHSLDRYPDMNGNYEPGNVRWATQQEQCQNTRRNILFTLHGITQPLAAWVQMYTMNYMKVYKRLKRGWSIEEALGLSEERQGMPHLQGIGSYAVPHELWLQLPLFPPFQHATQAEVQGDQS